MRGQSGHLVNGSGPYCVHDWREAEVELDITRRRRASLPEQRKKKVGKERGRVSNGGGRAGSGRGTLMSTGMLVWISCGSHPHASNWWVPRVITQIANPRVFHFTVKQSHVALELLFASKTSHHSHSFQQRRTPSNSHEKRRTGAIDPSEGNMP